MANTTIEIQDLKRMLAELIQSQKETDAKFKATNAELDARFKETDAQLKASSAELNRLFKETDAKFKETDAQFKETDKRIKAAFDLFEGQWGKLIESLVEGDLLNLLQKRGVEVQNISTRRKGNYQGTSYEFDLIAHNGGEIVIVEVKTTLRVSHVKKFIKRLEQAKTWLSEYKHYKVYGAVAYLKAYEKSDTFAEDKKLFVIRATGDSASIINAADFEPRVF